MGFLMVGEVSVVRSYRMKPEDYALVEEAAAKLDVYPSTFVRQAALMRARTAGGTDPSEGSEKQTALMTAEQERLVRGLLVNLRGSRGLLNQIAKALNIYLKSGRGDLPTDKECLAAITSVDTATQEITQKVAEWGGEV